LVLVTSIASAATNKPTMTFISPSPAEGATLATNAVSLAFSYNRTSKQTRSLTCVLAGPTSFSPADCTPPTTSGSVSTSTNNDYTGLSNGSYLLTATLTLTDGGTVSATRHFTINTPLGHVYWTTSGGSAADAIGRASSQGQNSNPGFIGLPGRHPQGVAVDASHVYWVEYAAGTIGRADLDGTNVDESFITGADAPQAIAVDSGHVYWTNSLTGSIGRADLDGQNVNQSFVVTPVESVVGLAVDAGHIYWTSSSPFDPLVGAIGRADIDGTNVDDDFITGATHPLGVAVDANHIYWSNTFADSIGRADLDGGNADQTFISSGAVFPRAVALDSGHLYWTNLDDETVSRAELSGQNVVHAFIATDSDPDVVTFPDGLAVGPN
jgi:virginiamycin B lyase